MSYEIAISKAWEELSKLQPEGIMPVKFMSYEYSIEPSDRKVMSASYNVLAKDFTAILILHYLIRKLKGLPELSGEWLTFREFSGIEGYYEAFKKRSIDPIIRKYGKNPEGILSVLSRLPAKKAEGGDFALLIDTFEGVPVLIKLWKGDEEFGPDANIYFDKSIKDIFCTEDIVVLAGLVAGQL